MSVQRIGLFRSPAGFRSFSMARYTNEMASALRAHASPDVSLHEVCPDTHRTLSTRRSRCFSRYVRYGLLAQRTSFALNHVLDQANAHLMYVLDPDRSAISCHDVFPIKRWLGLIRGVEPTRVPPTKVQVSFSGLRLARCVLVGSQATKEDLVNVIDVDQMRVHVVPYGISSCFAPGPPKERAGCTILSVSTGLPYKNERAAVEVLARVARRPDLDVRLLRIGPALSPADAERAGHYGVRSRIQELGHPPDATLAEVYRQSDVLLFPSFYEGFGWPPLEAMASGLPVVASTSASLLEVTGGTALHAPAEDYDGLANHVLTVLTEEPVAQDLSRRGLRRAEQFSWNRVAKRVFELYETILAEGT